MSFGWELFLLLFGWIIRRMGGEKGGKTNIHSFPLHFFFFFFRQIEGLGGGWKGKESLFDDL